LPTIVKIFSKAVYNQDRQCKYKRNVEERSRNHCRVGKDISVTYIEYVSVKVKVKQSRYRPGVPQRVPGS
jgi:hypothetical protein